MIRFIFASVLLFSVSLFADTQLDELKQMHKNHIVKNYQTWNNWQDKTFTQRIQSAPNNVIEYIGLDNKIYGYEGVPKAAKKDLSFQKDFMEVLNGLPDKVQEQLKKYLIGIFFVSDLGSSGFSEHVYKDGKYYGGWILFDQEILSKLKANEWATWRVNSAFKPSKENKLSLKIANSSNDNRQEAIEFILLHEIGHIVGSASNAHPKPDEWNDDPKKFNYSKISWNSIGESIFDKSFDSRKEFKLYRFDKAELGLDKAKGMISQLKQTDFCSLYASNSFFEDFAEGYAIYVHTILMNKPYELILKYQGKEVASFSDPFGSINIQRKKNYFDALFKASSN